MYNPNADLLCMDDIRKARERIQTNEHFVRTPMLRNVQDIFQVPECTLHMKLENMQTTGSFKLRGVLNQMMTLPEGYGTEDRQLISMSAGNYGKSFAFVANKMGLKGTVIMPESAPVNRAELIRGYGINVERVAVTELQRTTDKHVEKDGMVFLHSFDDPVLMAGHASAGLEILEDEPDPDIVLVCCGGGGLVSGIAAAIKQSGKENCRIYAVEPEGSRTMHESYKQGKVVSYMAVKSVASGLSPPFAGPNTFRHCQAYVENVLLVSDHEITDSMFFLHSKGLYVEPSGAAAFAALRHDKVPDSRGKRVVVVITGGNVSPQELVDLKKTMKN